MRGWRANDMRGAMLNGVPMPVFRVFALLVCTAGMMFDPARAQNSEPLPSVVKEVTRPIADGKVAGLNAATFAVFQNIKKRNPGAFTEVDAMELKRAVMADGKIDAAERDLLGELTNSQFRSITVTPEGAVLKPPATPPKVISYPVSGNAKRVLLDTLNPPADLAREWDGGAAGWNNIIRAYAQSATEEVRVVNFVAGKLGQQWELSNLANGYKPLRDVIGQRYGFSNSAGSNADVGRAILYKAMNQVDRNAADAVPDFLYNWVRPGSYL
ncbi:MAG: hypothetical protein RLZZ58_1422 [Pseudomonadota bacterium]